MIDLSSNHIEAPPPPHLTRLRHFLLSRQSEDYFTWGIKSDLCFIKLKLLLRLYRFDDDDFNGNFILFRVSKSQNLSSWDWNFINNHFTTIELSLALLVFIFHLSQETRIYFRKCTFPIVFARYEQQIFSTSSLSRFGGWFFRKHSEAWRKIRQQLWASLCPKGSGSHAMHQIRR